MALVAHRGVRQAAFSLGEPLFTCCQGRLRLLRPRSPLASSLHGFGTSDVKLMSMRLTDESARLLVSRREHCALATTKQVAHGFFSVLPVGQFPPACNMGA